MYIKSINWHQFFQELLNFSYFWPIFIGILILIIIWLRIRKNRQVIQLFKNSEGNVALVQNALIDLMKQTCHDVAPESKPHVYLWTKNNTLNIKVKMQISSDQHIETTASIIQKQLHIVLKDTLGLEKIGSINILITGFNKKPKRNDSKVISEIE